MAPSSRTHGLAQNALLAASLSGVLALPLAALHNQPRFILETPSLLSDGNLALLLDVLFGALLASLGAGVCAASRAQERPSRLLTWLAALLGGCAASYGAYRLLLVTDGHPSGSVPNTLLNLVVAVSLGSLGAFHFCGAPLLVLIRTGRAASLGSSARLLWLFCAVLIGGAAIAAAFSAVIDRSGVGIEGSGMLAMFVWPYFSWGAGTGAVLMAVSGATKEP
jgi:hypothetical protein